VRTDRIDFLAFVQIVYALSDCVMSDGKITDIYRENYDVAQENPPEWSPNGGILVFTLSRGV